MWIRQALNNNTKIVAPQKVLSILKNILHTLSPIVIKPVTAATFKQVGRDGKMNTSGHIFLLQPLHPTTLSGYNVCLHDSSVQYIAVLLCRSKRAVSLDNVERHSQSNRQKWMEKQLWSCVHWPLQCHLPSYSVIQSFALI